MPLSQQLTKKIEELKISSPKLNIGTLSFPSPLLLAPLAGVTDAPFRLLMQDLGSGGTVTELISSQGIKYNNKHTEDMLRLDPREKNVGIQLFAPDAKTIAQSIPHVLENKPTFIDINMGCPVRKVVSKGAGSALLQDSSKLPAFFREIRKACPIPLSIKIRLGWSEASINVLEVVRMAQDEGIDFVTIHGRTRDQFYTGRANWDLIEKAAQASSIPLLGNGDLHTTQQVKDRLTQTHCDGLMLGRGPLHEPFIFLESFSVAQSPFDKKDYLEIMKLYHQYQIECLTSEKLLFTQIKKIVSSFSHGFAESAKFRTRLFTSESLEQMWQHVEEFFSIP